MQRPELEPPEILYPESDGKPMAETDIHRALMVDLIDALSVRYQDQPRVYVTGNLLLYFEEGKPQSVVSPDLMVVFGVPKGPRRIYKLWEEGKGPDFVLELTSRSTHREDLGFKRTLYEELGVREYFLFDPEGKRLRPPLRGYRRRDGAFQAVSPARSASGSLVLASEVLGLELHAEGASCHLVEAATSAYLPTRAQAEARRADTERQRADVERQRAEAERQRAEAERQRAEAERQRAERAEAELARARDEIARLRRGEGAG
jgi:Uma2 family endonuclease